MRRLLPGGVSLIDPQPRPNVYYPFGVGEMIERRGESAFWFRFSPCPCPDELRTAACPTCRPHTGYVKTFQTTRLIEGESPIIQDNIVTPGWAPIVDVKRLWYSFAGVEHRPEIARVDPERIQLAKPLEYWRNLKMDYVVSLVEEQVIETKVFNQSRVRLFQSYRQIILEVIHAFAGTGEPLEVAGHGFDSVYLARRFTGLVRVRVKTYNPIRVGYSTFDLSENNFKPGRSAIRLEEGEIQIVVDQAIKMGEGDILTLLVSDVRATQSVPFQPGPEDRLKYAPVKEILHCAGMESAGGALRELGEGEDFVLASYDTIRWLKPKPQAGFTILYLYHPSYRVTGPVTMGSAGDRNGPRMYRAKAISSYGAPEVRHPS